MKKIAFIVQRYGVEVNGGAEYHCRILAERLKALYEVDVLTSCAQDYISWANQYPAGASDINGVNVVRFPTAYNRDEEGFAFMIHKLTRKPPPDQSKLSILLETWGRYITGKTLNYYGKLWAQYQGPYVPELIQYLKRHHRKYDALIFFTYLYYPTIEGLKIAPRKSILIPTAHDEPTIYLPVFRKLFSLPKALLYNSISEKQFVNQTFRNESIYADIVGVGIEPAENSSDNSAADIVGSKAPYLIYIGRINSAKGCDILFDYFIRYKEKYVTPLKLVLVGQAFIPIPDHPDILAVGFVDEAMKITLLKAAKSLIISSFYESLSMVTLESFSYGIPVIANENCEVLKDHVEASKAGFLYGDYPDFERSVQQVLTQDLSEMAKNAQMYVEQNYTWAKVLAKFEKAVNYVVGH